MRTNIAPENTSEILDLVASSNNVNTPQPFPIRWEPTRYSFLVQVPISLKVGRRLKVYNNDQNKLSLKKCLEIGKRIAWFCGLKQFAEFFLRQWSINKTKTRTFLSFYKFYIFVLKIYHQYHISFPSAT